MSKKRILVVVVTYNPHEWVNRCFGSLRTSVMNVDALVVDNNSTDGGVMEIQEKYPEVMIYRSRKNLGFGQANNVGLRYALEKGYDYVYLLNQDAWVLSDTLQTLVSVAEKHDEYGILSPMQLEKDEKTYESLFYKYVICSDNLRCSLHEKLYNVDTLEEVYDIPFAMAAHWLVTKRCLQTVGGFSPTFFHYGEDNNYIHRVFFHGFKLGLVPYAKAVHDSGMKSVKVLRDSAHYRIYNSELVYLSNPNTDYLIKNSIKSFIIKGIVEKDAAYLRNAWLLYKNRGVIIENRNISKKRSSFL